MVCRICGEETCVVLDLGETPPANSLLSSPGMEIDRFPLVLEHCKSCCNLQLRDCLNSNDLYKNYLYVTPDSTMLHQHYDYLTNFLFKNKYLSKDSNVVEVGSNIGLYLKYLKPHVKSVVGIDPAENIAKVANKDGIPTVCDFFSENTAEEMLKTRGPADTIVARHCFAHNQSPHELLKGVKTLLAADGSIVIENAYALNTVENNEFDQIYHEHMFYYSIQSMSKALELNGLKLVDILISLVHGGSIVFVAKHVSEANKISESVATHLAYEQIMLNDNAIQNFAANVYKIKSELNAFIKNCRETGKVIHSYGATAKGNTLLNFLGVSNEDIQLCVDNTLIKIGKYLPGTNIIIGGEENVVNNPPDYYLLTAWNYKDEIITKVRKLGNYKSAFVVPFPNLGIV